MKRKPARKTKRPAKRVRIVYKPARVSKRVTPGMICASNVCIPEPTPKCPHCGYGHVILKNLPGCPMCKVCGGCQKRLMQCDCFEGE